MTRDFVGYGAEPPHAQWPGNARIAVNFVINFEEGSELSYPAGDGVSEGGLTEMLGADLGVTGRDLGAESMFEYGARVGFWRLHRIFTRFALPVTIFGCAKAFEANPPAAAAIAASDWDICSHGYRWINHPGLSEAEERKQIAEAVELIRQTTGKTPAGWYCRYAPSENTRRLLVEHGGFLYDSDTYNDELPYWVRVNDRPHLVVPYSLTTNDSKFGRGVFGSGEDFFAFLRDSFDLSLRRGRGAPAHDVGGAAYAADGTSRQGEGADPLHPIHPRTPPGVGMPPRGHRPPLDGPLSRSGLRSEPVVSQN